MNIFTDKFFWFAQPSTVLNSYDTAAGYLFAGLVALSLIMWAVNKLFVKHAVVQKLLRKWTTAIFWFGIVGLIWFGFRYQAVPIFSKRWWAGAIIIGGLVWLGFVKWYLIRHFMKEKREYDYNQVKSKYMPGKR